MYYSHNQISLTHFRKKACIDRMKVKLYFQNQIHFWDIQKVFEDEGWKTPRVDAVEEKPGKVATTFIVEVHDSLANDYSALLHVLDLVGVKYPMSQSPTIAGIEIACDFYHKGGTSNSRHDLLALTYRLQTSLYVRNGINHRQYDPEIKGNRFLDREGSRINPEQNLRINPKGSDLSWQVYFKWFDNFNKDDKTYETLKPKDWRARVEVTILGSELLKIGLVNLSDLAGFRFQTLTNLFKFRKPSNPEAIAANDPFRLAAIVKNRLVNDATPARGIHSFDNLGRLDKWRHKTRAESRHLEVDDELRVAVKDAFKRMAV